MAWPNLFVKYTASQKENLLQSLQVIQSWTTLYTRYDWIDNLKVLIHSEQGLKKYTTKILKSIFF